MADTHTHPRTDLAYGGLVYGSPLVPLTAQRCDGYTHGGNYTVAGVDTSSTNVAAQVVTARTAPSSNLAGNHHHQGGAPDWGGWPRWDDTVHCQYHVDYIRRAYEAGLRLMSTLAVNNRLLSRLMGDGHEMDDGTAIRRQLDGFKEIVAANSEWMEIALSAEDLRRIVGRDDKLAVVLGVEVDQIDQFSSHQFNPLLPGADLPAAMEDLAADLVNAGVRQVTPVHFADNLFGGYALYGNEILFRTWANPFATGSRYACGSFPTWQVELSVDFRLSNTQLIATPGSDLHLVGFSPSGPVQETLLQERDFTLDLSSIILTPDGTPGGHINARDLTEVGRQFLLALMKRGCLIDIDHMGQLTAQSSLDLAEANAYPLMSSHTAFRDICVPIDDPRGYTGRQPWTDLNEQFRNSDRRVAPIRSERGHTDSTIRRILASGGTIAPGFSEPGLPLVDPQFGVNQESVPVNCSYGWATSYLHAVSLTQGSGVCISSDYGLAHSMAPATGPNAQPSASGLVDSSGHWNAGRVNYVGSRIPPDPPDAINYCTAGRTFDFNTEGLAHYGLLPDALQEIRNLGVTPEQMKSMFNGTQAYYEMWQRCEMRAPFIHN